MPRVAALLLILLLPFLLPACALLPGGEEHQRTYQLLAPDFENTTAGRVPADLSVMRVEVQPGYDTSAMAYRENDYELQYFVRNRWADRPSRMLQPAVISALQARGPFRNTVDGTAGIASRFRLDLELIRLEQDFRHDPSRVHMDMRVRLLDRRNRELLFTDVLRISRETAENNPQGGVAAANAALAELLERLSDLLAEATAGLDVAPDDGVEYQDRPRWAPTQRNRP